MTYQIDHTLCADPTDNAWETQPHALVTDPPPCEEPCPHFGHCRTTGHSCQAVQAWYSEMEWRDLDRTPCANPPGIDKSQSRYVNDHPNRLEAVAILEKWPEGYSITEIARRMGVAYERLREWRKGIGKPSEQQLDLIRAAPIPAPKEDRWRRIMEQLEGMTQRQKAKVTGIPCTSLVKWLRGRALPPSRRLDEMEERMGLVGKN